MLLDLSKELALLSGRNTRAEPVFVRWRGVAKFGKLNKLVVCPVCGNKITGIKVVYGRRGRITYIAYYAYHGLIPPHRLGVIEYVPLSELEKEKF